MNYPVGSRTVTSVEGSFIFRYPDQFSYRLPRLFCLGVSILEKSCAFP